ncbi:MAG: hypothetical protein V4675_18940 [Verrucomicrobiota bacterium]
MPAEPPKKRTALQGAEPESIRLAAEILLEEALNRWIGSGRLVQKLYFQL